MISLLKKLHLNVFFIPVLLGIVLGYFTYRVNVKNGITNHAIRSDGTGYYAYLPAIFIYNDLQFDFLDDKNLINDDGASRVTLDNGKIVNKYTCGLAFLQFPFFLIAYFLSFLFGQSPDGYAPIFQWFFLLGNTVYFTVGLVFLNKILHFFRIKTWIAIWVLLVFTAGNSVLHYTTYDAYHSHAFSLSLMIGLVYFILQFEQTPKKKYAIFIGVLFGLITLVRPFNLIAIICLPILFHQAKQIAGIISNVFPYILYFLIPFILTLSIQLVLWKIQTGSFILYSYGSESFIWGTHDPWFALFSYRRGFFIYNPIWLIAIIFYLYHFKKISFSFISIIGAFGILVVLLSSWHKKSFGLCLGYRPLIEYQIFLLFPFLQLMNHRNFKPRYTAFILSIVSGLCIWYSIILSLQYQRNILKWEGPNKAEYWEIFGKTDARLKYHFFYPEQLVNTGYKQVEIHFNNSQVFSDTGIIVYPDSFTSDPIKGIGYYAKMRVSNPNYAMGVLDFYAGDQLLKWKHKLLSKDIKVENRIAPFYIDDFIRDTSINKIVLKFDNIREASFLEVQNSAKLILFTEPIQHEKRDSTNFRSNF